MIWGYKERVSPALGRSVLLQVYKEALVNWEGLHSSCVPLLVVSPLVFARGPFAIHIADDNSLAFDVKIADLGIYYRALSLSSLLNCGVLLVFDAEIVRRLARMRVRHLCRIELERSRLDGVFVLLGKVPIALNDDLDFLPTSCELLIQVLFCSPKINLLSRFV